MSNNIFAMLPILLSRVMSHIALLSRMASLAMGSVTQNQQQWKNKQCKIPEINTP